MSRQYVHSMQTASKLVGEALQLDSENHDEAAYRKYLESVSYVANTLFDSQSAPRQDRGRLTPAQTNRLIEVAKQCLDRIEILSKRLLKSESNDGRSAEEACSTELIAVPSLEPSTIDNTKKCSKFSVLESIDWLSPEEPSEDATPSVAAISPLERVQKENAALVETYKARLARMSNQAARSNLTLELQRRLAENLQVARAQQEIYLRQIKEEQKKRLEEATRKLAHGEEFKHRGEIYVQVLEYENNNKWITKTRKQLDENTESEEIAALTIRRTLRDVNHPIAKLLKRKADELSDKIRPLLSSDEKHMEPTEESERRSSCERSDLSNLRDWNENDDEDFKDDDLDSPVVEEAFEDSFSRNARELETAIASGNVLMSSLKSAVKKQRKSLKKNPLKNLKKLKLKKDEEEELKVMSEQKEPASNETGSRGDILKLEVEALQRHLESFTCDARQAMDEVVELLLLTFDQLDKGEHRELCHSVVEEYYYDTTWRLLLQLCRLAKRSDENLVVDAMDRLAECTPAELGFTKGMPPDFGERYAEAVKLLKHMTTLDIPSKKLNVLVAVAKVICERLGNHENGVAASKTKSFGADDLIPLLSYVCIRSGISQLICECHLLEELMDQKYLMGEEGYCLTSLLTSLQYIQTLERKKEEFKPVETTV